MYLFGKNVLYEYLKTNTIKQVYLTKKDLKIVKVLEQNQIKYQFVGDDFLQQNQINCHHQGIIIELKQKTVTSDLKTYLRTELKQKAIFLIVDSLQDSQNFGAILRSALAFNVINIVYKKDQQVQINDLVIKASMGAINHLNLWKITNLSQTIVLLKEHGFWIYGAIIGNDTIPLAKVTFNDKMAIMVGNEHTGISQNLIKLCDYRFMIPINTAINSLNVSAACAIILFFFTNKC